MCFWVHNFSIIQNDQIKLLPVTWIWFSSINGISSLGLSNCSIKIYRTYLFINMKTWQNKYYVKLSFLTKWKEKIHFDFAEFENFIVFLLISSCKSHFPSIVFDKHYYLLMCYKYFIECNGWKWNRKIRNHLVVEKVKKTWKFLQWCFFTEWTEKTCRRDENFRYENKLLLWIDGHTIFHSELKSGNLNHFQMNPSRMDDGSRQIQCCV